MVLDPKRQLYLFQGTRYWRDDRNFGRQRLQGCNPSMIRLCTEIPQKLVYICGFCRFNAIM